MRTLLLATILILVISCAQTQQKQKTILPPDFDKEFSLDTSVKFKNVRDVAYGYSFSFPISFVEFSDTIGQVDSLMFYSQDRLTKIKFFIEGDIQKSKNESDKTENKAFNEYFDSLTNNKHKLTQNAKIIKATQSFKHFEYGRPAKFMLLGERQSTEFILNTELSEVPISGDLTFKSFIMEYPKTNKSYYRPVALDIAKNFGQ